MSAQDRDFSCILCGGAAGRLVTDTVLGDRNGALKVVECGVCTHVQLSPPSYSLDFYREDGQVNFIVHNFGTPLEKLVEHSWIEARRRVNRLTEKGLSLPSGGSFRAIDVGGGYGFFGAELKTRYPDADVWVLEPSIGRAEAGEAYLTGRQPPVAKPVFVTRMLDDDFVDAHRGTFDLVTLWHVLEHVTDPVSLVRNAAALLRPGGALCIEVPNLDDELKSYSSKFRERCYIMEHVSYFSVRMLESVVRRAAPFEQVNTHGYQRYGIYNYFHWIAFNAPQGADPDLFSGEDRWWLEASWRAVRESSRTSDALYLSAISPGTLS